MIPIEHVSERPKDASAPPAPSPGGAGPQGSPGVPIARLPVPSKGEE